MIYCLLGVYYFSQAQLMYFDTMMQPGGAKERKKDRELENTEERGVLHVPASFPQDFEFVSFL